MSKKVEPPKRSSRAKTISKAMRLVDEDTRREVRERRIQQLEADNYAEEQQSSAVDDEDAYVESDVSSLDPEKAFPMH
jgi:zinc finger HIT domain-containing protein 1